MPSPNTTANAIFSLGSSSQKASFNQNLDLGQAIANIVITGTIDDDGTNRKIKFSDLGKIKLTANGSDTMDFSSGYELYQYLSCHGFINNNDNGTPMTDFIQLPQYRNVDSAIQRRLTYLDTGTNGVIQTGVSTVNLSVEVLGSNSEDASVLTNSNIYFQTFTTDLTGVSSHIEVKTYKQEIATTGKADIKDIPRIGLLSSLMLIPPHNTSATAASGVKFNLTHLVINGTEVATLNGETVDRDLKQSNYAIVPRLGYATTAIDVDRYIVFNPCLDGSGADSSGNLNVVSLEPPLVQSFRARLNVSSKGNITNPSVVMIVATIEG